MPIEVGIWRVDGDQPQPVLSAVLASESRLEDILEQDLTILGLDSLLVVGRQVGTKYGKWIDLLALDVSGRVYVLELKRNQTSREVVAQALDYGYWVRGLTLEDLSEIYTRRGDGQTLSAAFRAHFREELPDELDPAHQLIIVASALDAATERIVDYVAEYDLPLNVVFFQYFKDGDAEYLTRSWLIDPAEAEMRSKGKSPRTARETWNGQDFYYSAGEDGRRTWADMREHGFICAGGGSWYSNTLRLLEPGHRVFACIPGTGYVGVGVVTESVQPLASLTAIVDGQSVPILEVPLRAPDAGMGGDSPDLREYAVRVEWIITVPRDQAVWEKGMYANQNSVTRLRSSFTVQRLTEAFSLDGDVEG